MQTTLLNGGRGWASPAAAASIHRIDRQLGRLADINEAGRSPEDADANYAAWIAYQNGTGPWAPRALPASESVHCRGDAADSDDWRDDNAATVWRENGWRRTAPDEWWHAEYFPEYDHHLNDPAPAAPAAIPSEEDDMDLALKINIGGTYHLATLIPGTFKGLIDGDDPELVKNQLRADDAWTPVTERQLQTLLHAAGVATDCYRRAGSSMEIRHAVTGVWSRGGRWSTSDILEALLGKAQAR